MRGAGKERRASRRVRADGARLPGTHGRAKESRGVLGRAEPSALNKTPRLFRGRGVASAYRQRGHISAGMQEGAVAPSSVCRQRPAARAFVDRTRFPCALGAAGETRREALLRKTSEPGAHVAGFGFHWEGFGPPDLPMGFSPVGSAYAQAAWHIDKWNTLQRGCRKGRPAPSYLIRSGGVYAARSGCKPLPLSCSGRALRAQEHDVSFRCKAAPSLAAKDCRHVDGRKP